MGNKEQWGEKTIQHIFLHVDYHEISVYLFIDPYDIKAEEYYLGREAGGQEEGKGRVVGWIWVKYNDTHIKMSYLVKYILQTN